MKNPCVKCLVDSTCVKTIDICQELKNFNRWCNDKEKEVLEFENTIDQVVLWLIAVCTSPFWWPVMWSKKFIVLPLLKKYKVKWGRK